MPRSRSVPASAAPAGLRSVPARAPPSLRLLTVPGGRRCGTVSVMARIEDYAMVGDLHTAALISTEGSIDWLCLPRFDSPACFSALLDTPAAGRWLLAPAGGGECTRRRYRKGTLILETEWETARGQGQDHRLHAAPRRSGGHRADRGRCPRHGADARRTGAAVRLRPYCAVGPPRRARDPRRRRARRRLSGDRGAPARRADAYRQRLHGHGRGTRALRADLEPQPPPPAALGGPGSGPGVHRGVLAATGRRSARSPGRTATPSSAR